MHLSELVKELKEEGFEFEPDDLSHVSLYAFEHIIQYGQYFFNLKLRDSTENQNIGDRLMWTAAGALLRDMPCGQNTEPNSKYSL